MATDPGLHLLVEDKLHVLMPGVGECHHETVGMPAPAGGGVAQHPGTSEVHLRALARG
jgi:hypothetical protein